MNRKNEICEIDILRRTQGQFLDNYTSIGFGHEIGDDARDAASAMHSHKIIDELRPIVRTAATTSRQLSTPQHMRKIQSSAQFTITNALTQAYCSVANTKV